MKTLLAIFVILTAPYNRSDWKHWVDNDHDCQDTRQEILIRDAIQLTIDGCKVIDGKWVDYYDGQIITQPRSIDIDHIVPLAEAHASGGDIWPPAKKKTYANDFENLVVTSAKYNRAKGSKRPDQWMPPDEGVWCDYVTKWKAVKTKYGLSFASKEKVEVEKALASCDDKKDKAISE